MGALEAAGRGLRGDVELHPQMRDVLAWAGTALMWGQMLESTLTTFNSLQAGRAPADGPRFRNLFRGVNAQPNNGGRRQTAAAGGRHLVLTNDLERSIRRRDFLVHNFFRSQNCQRLLQTDPGRRALVEELRGLADEFKGWADALAPVVLAYAVSRGALNRVQLMRRVEAHEGTLNPAESELAAQAQAALEMDPSGIDQMVQVLRELEARRNPR